MEKCKLFEYDDMGGGDQYDYMSFSLPARSLRFAKRDILNYDMIPYDRAKLVQQQRTYGNFTNRWDAFKGLAIGNLAQGTEMGSNKLAKGKVLRIEKSADGKDIVSYTILDDSTSTKKLLNPETTIKVVPMSKGTGRAFGGMSAISTL